MQYRDFGRTGIRVSALGFGGMRLPMVGEGDQRHVDYEKATEMIHRAIDLGVNFVDTAYMYCSGTSEIAVGKALKDRRDKVYLSSKCPMGEVKKREDYRRLLEEQLSKLDTDHIDFYHFHGINKSRFEDQVLGMDLIAEAEKARDEGLIRYISFSFHDEPDVMKEIVDTGAFDSLLCQYNLLDRRNEEAIAYAADKGVGVEVMGPVGGGRLSHPSEKLQNLAEGVKSTVELALRFVLANQSVSLALSGMGSMQHVEENARIASIAEPLSDDEKKSIEEALERTKKLADLYCTGCKYCMPCPNGVNIPECFQAMIYYKVYDLTEHAKRSYARIEGDRGKKADACIECGKCEPKCPQNIRIIEQLKEVASTLG